MKLLFPICLLSTIWDVNGSTELRGTASRRKLEDDCCQIEGGCYVFHGNTKVCYSNLDCAAFAFSSCESGQEEPDEDCCDAGGMCYAVHGGTTKVCYNYDDCKLYNLDNCVEPQDDPVVDCCDEGWNCYSLHGDTKVCHDLVDCGLHALEYCKPDHAPPESDCCDAAPDDCYTFHGDTKVCYPNTDCQAHALEYCSLPSAEPSQVPSTVPSQAPSDMPSVECDRNNCVAPGRVCTATGVTSCSDSTAKNMFDVIAHFATGDPSATYASTTTMTFNNLFSCTINHPDDDVPESQHFVWQGFVDYATANANVITIEDASGNGIQIIDEWGGRCEMEPNCNILLIGTANALLLVRLKC